MAENPATGWWGTLRLIRLHFFGRLSDLATQVPSRCAGETPHAIRQWLAEDFPELAVQLNEPQVLVSVNHCIVDWQTPLTDGDEVAFLPPVTGG